MLSLGVWFGNDVLEVEGEVDVDVDVGADADIIKYLINLLCS